MLFPSLHFLLFFGPVCTLAWLVNDRLVLWKLTLIIASGIFYAWWSFALLWLLVASCVVNYAVGRLIGEAPAPWRKPALIFGVAANLGVLVLCKYYKFVFTALANLIGHDAVFLPELDIILPLGVSFYTFQGVSYLVDIYRREVQPAALLDVLCFKMFFPQLIAGPIVRASQFLPQLVASPVFSRDAFLGGLWLILIGLVKKLFFANYLAQALVDPVFADPASFSQIDIAAAIYGYAVQIYCDFSGYSDMAIGLALLFGLTLPQNFDRPYLATSLQDFWRRWHISLSQWLRDYLYKPLGGNRIGNLRTYVNLMIVMTLGGLWHGAGWNFLIWGALHGVGLAIERALARAGLRTGGAVGWFVTLNVVCLAWVFFRSADFDAALLMLSGLWNSTATTALFSPAILFLIAAPVLAELHPGNRIRAMWLKLSMPGVAVLTAFAIAALVAIAPPTEAPFIYFQF